MSGDPLVSNQPVVQGVPQTDICLDSLHWVPVLHVRNHHFQFLIGFKASDYQTDPRSPKLAKLALTSSERQLEQAVEGLPPGSHALNVCHTCMLPGPHHAQGATSFGRKQT